MSNDQNPFDDEPANEPAATTKPSQTNQAVALRPPPGAELPAQVVPPDSRAPAPITAAQAKVEAVANLTMKAYERAATLQITPEESAKLAADFPDDAFKTGAAGKENLIYIEHAHLRDRLSSVFGMGQWAIIPRNRWAEDFRTSRGVDGIRVYVEAMLVIRGCFVGEAVGAMDYYPSNGQQDYSDAVEGAKTAALRRCAKELGIGLQAWKKDWCEGWHQRRRQGHSAPSAPRTSPPPARPQSPASAPSAQPAPKASAARPAQVDLPSKPVEDKGPLLAELRKLIGSAGYEAVIVRYLQENPTKTGGFLLMPNEGLEDLEPAKLRSIINGWDRVVPAVDLWQKENPETTPAAPATLATGEEWRAVVVSVPRKGTKRDEYLKNPDTLGSLYDACETDPEARKRLFGLAERFTVEESWTGNDGKTHTRRTEDIEADARLRQGLDAFGAWREALDEKEGK